MRAACVSVACPVRIDTTGIRKFSAASKLNAFATVVCTSKISKDIISCRNLSATVILSQANVRRQDGRRGATIPSVESLGTLSSKQTSSA